MECAEPAYRQRSPRASPLYRLFDERFEELKRVWSERFEATFGLWQRHGDAAVAAFVSCGDLACGFGEASAKPCLFAPFQGRLPEACRHPIPRFPRQSVRAIYLLSGPFASQSNIGNWVQSKDQCFVLLITNVDGQGKLDARGCWKTRGPLCPDHMLRG
jgi:hypothetical protein